MVNSDPFDCNLEQNRKDRLSVPNSTTEAPHSPCSSGTLKQSPTNDIPPATQAIEPTPTMTNELLNWPPVFCSLPLEKLRGLIDTIEGERSQATQPQKKFLCLYCERSFVTSNLRQKHVERCHLMKQGRRCSARRIQTQQSPTGCGFCGEACGSDGDLRVLFMHLVAAHSNKYFACVTCEERFASAVLLEEHNGRLHAQTEEKMTRSKLKRVSPENEDAEKKRELRGRRAAVKTGRIGIKRTSKFQNSNKVPVEHKQLKRSKSKPEETSNNKSLQFINPYPQFDSYFQVKKITDHSIDNLRISTLTFDDVFDKAFYTRIKNNIRENLLNHIDGKLFKNEESETRISNFEKTQMHEPPAHSIPENYGCDLTLNAVTPVASLLSSQFGEDLESQIEYGSKASKKRTQTKTEEVIRYKYLTRRKYQASILESKENRDLSKLDMWTQLIIKNRQQKMENEKKTPKELLDYTKCQEYKNKLQQEELNRILDKRGPFEDLKEEATKKAAFEKLNLSGSSICQENFSVVSDILSEILNQVCAESANVDHIEIAIKESHSSPETSSEDAEIPSYLKLRRTSTVRNEEEIDKSDRITLICSSQETENFDVPNAIARKKDEPVELSGEWARARIYICAACGFKLSNMKFLLEHKNMHHQNVWCQHYEFVGNQSELYRHLSIPVLGKVGVVEREAVMRFWQRSDARTCSKCSKLCHTLGELHRHILECGEDWSWMLVRKKCKYKPYGAKTRRKRRGLIKRTINIDENKPREKRKYRKRYEGPKSKPSDVESIQRMLANLPAKRATRKIMSLKDGFPRATKPKPSNAKVQTNLKSKQIKGRKKSKRNVKQPNNSNGKQSNLKTGLGRRKSLRKMTKVFSSHILDTANGLVIKKKVKSAIKKEMESEKKVLRSQKEEIRMDSVNDSKKKVSVNKSVVKGIKKYFPVRKTRAVDCDNKKNSSDVKLDNGNSGKSARKSLTADKQSEKCESVLKKPRLNIVDNFVRTFSVRKSKCKRETKEKSELNVCDKETKKRKIQSSLEKAVKKMKPNQKNTVGNLIKRKRKKGAIKETEDEEFSGMPELEKIPSTPEKNENAQELPVLTPVVFNFESDCVDSKPDDGKFEITQNNDPINATCKKGKMMKKPLKGLNDCIAMLTNKLQQNDMNKDCNESQEINDTLDEEKELISVDETVEKKAKVDRSESDEFINHLLKLEENSIDLSNTILKKNTSRTKKIKSEQPKRNKPVKKKTVNDSIAPREDIINHLMNSAILDLYSDQILMKTSFDDNLKTKKKPESDSEDDIPLFVLKKNIASTSNANTIDTIPEAINDLIETSETGRAEDKLNNKIEIDRSVSQSPQDMELCTSPIFFESRIKTISILNSPDATEEADKTQSETTNGELQTLDLSATTKQIDFEALALLNLSNESRVNDSPGESGVRRYSLLERESSSVDESSEEMIFVDSGISDSSKTLSPCDLSMKKFVKGRKSDVRSQRKNSTSTSEETECSGNNVEKRVTRRRNASLEESVKDTNCIDEGPLKVDTNDDEDRSEVREIKTMEDSENANKETPKKDLETFKTPLKSQDDNSFITTPDLNDKQLASRLKNGFKIRVKANKRGRKKMAKTEEETKEYPCTICNKSFLRNDSLTKHKKTLTHIAKLSKIEALEASLKSNETSKGDINISSILNGSDNYSKELSSNFPMHGNNASLKLADIINEVLNKPVVEENAANFADLVLQTASEVETKTTRCKSLGERKSFESDIKSRNYPEDFSESNNKNEVYVERNRTDSILEKQICLLENIIENRGALNYIGDISVSSVESESKNSSVAAKSTQNTSNGVNFIGANNIATNFIQPKPIQYEEISDDSANFNNHYDDQKSRKALNRDEELFLECCSLLKSGSEMSNYSKKSHQMTRALKSFSIKSGHDYPWMENKNSSLRCQLNGESNFMSDTSRVPTPLGDNFADDGCNSNTMTYNWQNSVREQEKKDRKETTNSKRETVFEDISEDKSDLSLVGGKEEMVTTFKDVHFPKEQDDLGCSLDDATGYESEGEGGDRSEREVVYGKSSNFGALIASALKTQFDSDTKCNKFETQEVNEDSTSIMDNKKPLTKGARKVFEGLKVSIPTEELNIAALLHNKSLPSNETIQSDTYSINDEEQNKSSKAKKEVPLKSDIGPKSKVKNCIKTLGRKIKPKALVEKLKSTKEESVKSKETDVYDFEETMDNTSNKNSLSLFRSFKSLTSDNNTAKSDEMSSNFLDSMSFGTRSVSSVSTSSQKSKKTSKTQNTKKKGLIVGRIFKNALKPKMSEDIKEIPSVDNNSLVNDYLLSCAEQNDEVVKATMTQEEMDMVFDKLLNEDNFSSSIKSAKNIPQTSEEPTNTPKFGRSKANKLKKRQRHNSESTDDEFGIGMQNRKKSNKKSDSINLEQELKECIGVASRKSQRKCTSGKQNVLVECWSSDESLNEAILESKRIFDATRNQEKKPLESIVKTSSKPQKHKSTRTSKIHKDCTSKIVDDPPESTSSGRRKRAAANTLYYWSSSSEDDLQDMIELKPIRDELEDDDCPMQHGWIVGDSPKKLVTMLAQAKGNKRLDANNVKEQSKGKNSMTCS